MFDILVISRFQSTYLREVRLEMLYANVKDFYFNPRTCERYDAIPELDRQVKEYFNPRTCERYDVTGYG